MVTTGIKAEIYMCKISEGTGELETIAIWGSGMAVAVLVCHVMMPWKPFKEDAGHTRSRIMR